MNTNAVGANGFLQGMIGGIIPQLPDDKFPPERKAELLAKAQDAHDTVHDALCAWICDDGQDVNDNAHDPEQPNHTTVLVGHTKVTVEHNGAMCTICDTVDMCDDVVRMALKAIVGVGFLPDSVDEAVCEMAEEVE